MNKKPVEVDLATTNGLVKCPRIGDHFRTMADAANFMTDSVSVTVPQFMYNASAYFRDAHGNKIDEAVFYHEDGDQWDLTSTHSNAAYIIENWLGGVRTPTNLGGQRHTFVKRRGKNEYEYLGIYKIEAIFNAPKGVKNQHGDSAIDGFTQLTLWKRV